MYRYRRGNPGVSGWAGLATRGASRSGEYSSEGMPGRRDYYVLGRAVIAAPADQAREKAWRGAEIKAVCWLLPRGFGGVVSVTGHRSARHASAKRAKVPISLEAQRGPLQPRRTAPEPIGQTVGVGRGVKKYRNLHGGYFHSCFFPWEMGGEGYLTRYLLLVSAPAALRLRPLYLVRRMLREATEGSLSCLFSLPSRITR
jgi:hypothetical protein